jgi:hypothetical protein
MKRRNGSGIVVIVNQDRRGDVSHSNTGWGIIAKNHCHGHDAMGFGTRALAAIGTVVVIDGRRRVIVGRGRWRRKKCSLQAASTEARREPGIENSQR